MSKLLGKTSKTEGLDYKIPSHRLLTQAGYIRESTAGRYYFLPLGERVQNKIIEIVRKHMDASGAQELLMPIMHPLELWQETNRTETTGFELMKVTDRRGADFVPGGTAEEMVVDLIRKFNISYKDLPLNVYQFSMKFRDELRSRGGLLRVREFIMKDAYSFSNEADFKELYQLMWDTYTAIFEEVGLETAVVAADNGYIGGEFCHEFVVESPVGESKYFVTEDGSYIAHEDVAEFKKFDGKSDEAMKDREDVEGKGIIGVDELAKFLKMPVEQTTKTILFEDMTGRVVAAAVNGIYDINETKLQHVVGGAPLQLASPETVKKVTGAEVGYAGLLDLPKEVVIVMDDSLQGRKNFEMGANRTNYHSINVNFGRDLPEPEQFHDIALAKDGYEALNGQKLIGKKGIEVGNIFQLGRHYSSLMKNAEYTDEHGQRQKYYMGCYGIGIGRTMAAIVEAHRDDKGIAWPSQVAPYHAYLVQLGDDQTVSATASKLYRELAAAGVEVLFDDRDVRAGEKFADADLIGIPFRLVVSAKTLEQGSVELKHRTADKVELVKINEIAKKLALLV
jgi:prolyl-tRNA synthetase